MASAAGVAGVRATLDLGRKSSKCVQCGEPDSGSRATGREPRCGYIPGNADRETKRPASLPPCAITSRRNTAGQHAGQYECQRKVEMSYSLQSRNVRFSRAGRGGVVVSSEER